MTKPCGLNFQFVGIPTLEVREEFFSMCNAPDSRADTLYKAARKMVLRAGLEFHNPRAWVHGRKIYWRAEKDYGLETRVLPCSNHCLDLALP